MDGLARVNNTEESSKSGSQDGEVSEELTFLEPRSTSTPEINMENAAAMRRMMAEVMAEKIQEQTTELKKEMQASAAQLKEDLLQKMEQMEQKNMELESKLEDMKSQWQMERKVMIERMAEQESRLERVERSEKKCNVIFTNYETKKEGRELAKELGEMLVNKTGKQIDVVEARKWINKGNKNVVWARLQTFEQKIELMRNKKQLKVNREGHDTPIFVDDDLTREEREIGYRARQCRNECAKKYGSAEIRYEKGRPIVKAMGKSWIWNAETKEYLPTE